MAEITMLNTPSSNGEITPLPGLPKQRALPPQQLYVLPVPIRTFPLPAFYPSNPVSLLHLACEWLRQCFSPPPAEPSTIHRGTWDPHTRSVHITDPASMRALWEQGFYGKGNLSRSEPNWLKREQIRRGVAAGNVSEQRTVSRREERRMAKWERARIEQEAIERTRLEEAALALAVTAPKSIVPSVQPMTELPDPQEPPVRQTPPIGPLELLALPNSLADLLGVQRKIQDGLPKQVPAGLWKSPVGPLELLALPNSLADLKVAQDKATTGDIDARAPSPPLVNGTLLPAPALEVDFSPQRNDGLPNGIDGPDAVRPGAYTEKYPAINGDANGMSQSSNGTISLGSPLVDQDVRKSSPAGMKSEQSRLKHRKSVRFSPTVESATFQLTDPPSPYHSAGSSQNVTARVANGVASQKAHKPASEPAGGALDSQEVIPNKEHLQLSPEEAFFLVFAIGALAVVDGATEKPIPSEKLLTLFRSHSYFPPRSLGSPASNLQPDDPFLIHYVVYHHFRSLGWVPRHGPKFGVDWLLYQRGPVFDHAEFGLIVLPSFSHPWWKEHGRQSPQKSWQWLHGVNRVLSHVLKSLVLVYVDIPPPPVFDEAMAREGPNGGFVAVLKKYRVREMMVRRWSSNRNR